MTATYGTYGLGHFGRAAEQWHDNWICLCWTRLQVWYFNDVYTASKFAIEGFCESMAVQLLKFNVK